MFNCKPRLTFKEVSAYLFDRGHKNTRGKPWSDGDLHRLVTAFVPEYKNMKKTKKRIKEAQLTLDFLPPKPKKISIPVEPMPKPTPKVSSKITTQSEFDLRVERIIAAQDFAPEHKEAAVSRLLDELKDTYRKRIKEANDVDA